jgi:perosamine synthetase
MRAERSIVQPKSMVRPDEPARESRVPLCVPELTGNEAKYLNEAIASGWVSYLGPFVDRFEHCLKTEIGASHALAVSSGTAALHLALRVAGVRANDEVLVSTLTFIAPANAIRYLGAFPLFVDCESRFGQIDTALIVDFLAQGCERRGSEVFNRKTGRRIAAILPVHVLGHPVDMDPLLECAKAYALPVIEDATEALGARYRGRAVGSLGDIGCFSFNGNKLITSGGGGMVVTERADWAKLARHLSTQAKADPVEYVHDQVGYNYRLTNVQAAVGVAQAERLAEFLAAKRAIAGRYAFGLKNIPGITLMAEADWAESAFWMYTIAIDPARFGLGCREVQKRLAASGIDTRPLWQPLHRSLAHQGVDGTAAERLGGDVAWWMYQHSLSLPCSVGLTPQDQNRVLAALAGLTIAP